MAWITSDRLRVSEWLKTWVDSPVSACPEVPSCIPRIAARIACNSQIRLAGARSCATLGGPKTEGINAPPGNLPRGINVAQEQSQLTASCVLTHAAQAADRRA